MKVVLLDRDGVINRNREDYVKSLDELEILSGVPEAIAKLNRAGFEVLVISNQQAIGKGIISLEQLSEINSAVRSSVEAAGGRIARIYFCPHLQSERCGCRKPEIGMFQNASRDFGFALTDAWFVGDAPGDFKAGRRAGCKTVGVLSGKLSLEDIDALDVKPLFVADDLAGAADIIVDQSS